MKWMPFQSMNPSPVQAAAKRSVSRSNSAHRRPRETPPAPASSRTATPLYAMFGPGPPTS
ncbi:MAG: hypothetical protein U0871_18810 [Gemmataceae bacterium]